MKAHFNIQRNCPKNSWQNSSVFTRKPFQTSHRLFFIEWRSGNGIGMFIMSRNLKTRAYYTSSILTERVLKSVMSNRLEVCIIHCISNWGFSTVILGWNWSLRSQIAFIRICRTLPIILWLTFVVKSLLLWFILTQTSNKPFQRFFSSIPAGSAFSESILLIVISIFIEDFPLIFESFQINSLFFRNSQILSFWSHNMITIFWIYEGSWFNTFFLRQNFRSTLFHRVQRIILRESSNLYIENIIKALVDWSLIFAKLCNLSNGTKTLVYNWLWCSECE